MSHRERDCGSYSGGGVETPPTAAELRDSVQINRDWVAMGRKGINSDGTPMDDETKKFFINEGRRGVREDQRLAMKLGIDLNEEATP